MNAKATLDGIHFLEGTAGVNEAIIQLLLNEPNMLKQEYFRTKRTT